MLSIFLIFCLLYALPEFPCMKIVCLCLIEKTTGKYLGLATKNNLNIYEFATPLSLISSCGNNGVVGRLNKTLCDKGSGWHIE